MGRNNKISAGGHVAQEWLTPPHDKESCAFPSERLREQEPRASVPSPRVAAHTRTDPQPCDIEEISPTPTKFVDSDWTGQSRQRTQTDSSNDSRLQQDEWQHSRWNSSSWNAQSWWSVGEDCVARDPEGETVVERTPPSHSGAQVVGTSERYVVDASEIERAKEVGVLEAQLYKDGYWYVDLGNETYKRVECDFWCPLCEATLYHTNLMAHIQSDKHRRRLVQHQPIVSTCQPCAPCEPEPALEAWQQLVDGIVRCIPCRKQCDGYHEQSPDHFRRVQVFLEARRISRAKNSALERWQADDVDGCGIRCIPCKKICDGYHEQTPDHKRKLREWLSAQRKEYDAPEDDWLAYVECEGVRQLRCLMCEKWVVDFDGADASLYIDGEHSRLSERNQKDHKKRMQQLDEYMNDRGYWKAILAEKARWHPSFKPRVRIAPEIEESPLPEGWHAAWSEYYQCFYYYRAGRPAQWTRPSLDDEDVAE